MGHLNRRQFVAAAGATLILPAAARAAVPVWGFAAQSGRRIAGLLTVADLDHHEAAIGALRTRWQYRRPLAYSSTDRLRLPFALAVIAHVSQSPDLEFVASVMRDGETLDAARARLPTGIRPPGQYPELRALASFLTGCAHGHVFGVAHPQKREIVDAASRGKTMALVA